MFTSLLLISSVYICSLSRSFEVAATDKISREEIKKLSDTLTDREMEIKSLLVRTYVRSFTILSYAIFILMMKYCKRIQMIIYGIVNV